MTAVGELADKVGGLNAARIIWSSGPAAELRRPPRIAGAGNPGPAGRPHRGAAPAQSAVFSLDDDIQSNALDTHVPPAAQLEQASAGVEICGIRGVGYLLRALPSQAVAS